MTERVLLDIDLDQAKAVADLLDLANRIHMGQLEEISSLANQRLLLGRVDSSDEGVPLGAVDVDRIEELMFSAKSVLGHPRGGSFGIGARGLSMDAKRGYEVSKVLKKALHDHLRPEVRHTVDSTGLSVRYVPGDPPVARVVESGTLDPMGRTTTHPAGDALAGRIDE